MANAAHSTSLGSYYVGDATVLLRSPEFEHLKQRVQLIMTSPPFPLNTKKSYGNKNGDQYKEWFIGLATIFSDLLTDDGSIVIEVGNSWLPERPVQSLLHLESLIGFVNHPEAGLRLCQQFICYNPARLPSPAVWVTVKRIRLTDSYTNIWWMSKTDFPKANNRKVTRAYSKGMRSLLERQNYNAGRRPSEHIISQDAFLTDNGGSISHNVLEIEPMDKNREVRLPNAFSLSNNSSNDYFMRTCREKHITPHPARMPDGLVAFFVEFLTDPGDVVLDPFAGSNTTGYVAELLKRKWVSVEARQEYVEQSMIRFNDPSLSASEVVPQEAEQKQLFQDK